MKREKFQIGLAIQREAIAANVVAIRKKITLLVAFLLVAYLVQAQSSIYHQDENGTIRIMYEGKVDGNLHFRVILDNKEDNAASIKLVNSSAEVLYDGFYRRKEVIQKIKIESPYDNHFVFQIKRASVTKLISFEVDLISDFTDNVLIKPLAGKLL